MKKQFNGICLIFCMMASSIFSGLIGNQNGYKLGQRDALRGIYRIDQAERDYLDPEGARHVLAKPE